MRERWQGWRWRTRMSKLFMHGRPHRHVCVHRTVLTLYARLYYR